MPNLALLALEASDGTVVLTSITLVFAMLVALCLIITLEGKLFDLKNKKPADGDRSNSKVEHFRYNESLSITDRSNFRS